MTGALAGLVLPLSRGVVEPDRETARRWAVEELTRPEYTRAEPGLVQRVLGWVLDRLEELLADVQGVGGTGGLVVAALVVLAVVALVLLLAGPLRRRARRRGPAAADLFGGAVRTAAEHRAAAVAAARERRWREAVQERFRAVARSLEERVVLDVRPGRTADEVAREGGALLPDASEALTSAARAFDDVTYGGRDGDEAAYDACVAADDATARARPGAVATRAGAGT
ncbi:DUF4129 domain-containing protein [Aquipuribacter nitratireducens]|uniref:DUF4129 domain-containing protein n=1 Tax=Aquipuribacter nitratireducens TaxID=650104 RepID=A0ABW0GKR5_9MICO